MSSNLPHNTGNEEENSQSAAGVSMGDILSLPAAERQIVNWLVRQREATVAQVATQIERSDEIVLELLDRLVKQGFIQYTEIEGERLYRPRLAPKRNRSVPKNIWDKLGDR